MRFQSGFAARAERVAMETRAIERPSGVQQVLAPAGWSDVRIEAWLDWVEAEGFATPLSGDWLNGGVDAWAEYGRALTPFVEAGLVEYTPPVLRLTRQGMLLANEVAAVFA